MKITTSFIYSIAASLLILTGCASLSDMKRMDDLNETVKTYEKMVFWSEFDAALSFREPGKIDENQPDMGSLKKVRITSYKVKRFIATTDKSQVRQIVEISYYRMDNVSVKTIQDQQLWVFNPDAQRWYLQSELPTFD